MAPQPHELRDELGDYRQHWEIVEGGFRLRQLHGQHIGTHIIVQRGQIQCDVTRQLNDRESVRFLANRLWEAVAIAELQMTGLVI